MARWDSAAHGGQAVRRSKAEGALFTSQSWAEEPVLIRTPDPRLLTGNGGRSDLDVCSFSQALCHTAHRGSSPPPCHGVTAQNWALIQEKECRFCGTLLERPCLLLAPSCSVPLLGPRSPVSSRVRSRFAEITSRRAVLAAESTPLPDSD